MPTRIVWSATLLFAATASAQTALIGTAAIPGDALDKSGLTTTLSDHTPHNRLGSFGSGIAYTGSGNRYIAIDDRGPADGATEFHCRFQTFDITLTTGEHPSVSVQLIATTLLSTENGTVLNGGTRGINTTDQSQSIRLDPEGVRVSRSGTLFVSDEYGPWIDEFSMDGRRLRRFITPPAFLTSHPGPTPEDERHAKSGRQTNRGMEGLAISPDGSKLYAIMQSPLIQDGAVDAAGKRKGTGIRIYELDHATGASRQLLYPLSNPSHGVSEILAVNDHQFLVLERDGKAGAAAKNRSLFLIDTRSATDRSAIASLPADGVPSGVSAVSKKLFLDFNDPRFGLSGATMPEKIEGLTFGPDLPDGRRLLIVTVDNDLKTDVPSVFWAFAIGAADLPGFVPQQLGPSLQSLKPPPKP